LFKAVKQPIKFKSTLKKYMLQLSKKKDNIK